MHQLTLTISNTLVTAFIHLYLIVHVSLGHSIILTDIPFDFKNVLVNVKNTSD